MKISDKLVNVIKHIAMTRISKAEDCLSFLYLIVDKYVVDGEDNKKAMECLDYIKRQIEDVKRILEGL